MSFSRDAIPERISASSFQSVPDMWQHRVGSTPDGDAITHRVPGGWNTLTWRQVEVRVRRISNALLAFGLQPEQRCCILSQTRYEWILVDQAILNSGGATTTIYPSSTPAECTYIITHSDAVLVFAEDDQQVAKLLAHRERIPHIKKIVVIDGTPSDDGWVETLSAFEAAGREYARENPEAYNNASESISPEQLATLIYTSGTTGEPKGVMLSHDAWIYEAEALDMLGILTPADRQLLFLPLAHVFAKVLQVAFIRLGIPTIIDGNIDNLPDTMATQRPTFMGSVPRIFEKAHEQILQNVRESGPAKRQAFRWSMAVGRRVSALRQQGHEPRGLLKLRMAIAERLVFRQIKDKFGGRLRFFISGGAPLSRDICEFFHAADVLILEGYGLTESAAASTVNLPTDFRFGTVGKAMPGCDLRIEADGEILIRSRGVMLGYYHDNEATQDALTDDGWLRTGDIGVLHDTGHLQITDRKKELIITAGGKNVAPAHFTRLLKSRCPYVENVLMHGDGRPYCTALVTLNPERARDLAQKEGLSAKSYEELAKLDVLHSLIQAHIEEVNRGLPSYETVKKFVISPHPWTLENGAITPSLKVKRRVIEQRYDYLLEEMYKSE